MPQDKPVGGGYPMQEAAEQEAAEMDPQKA
jgi:hypothetical protein